MPREAVIARVAPLVTLRLDEVGQHLSIRPPRRATASPAVKISFVSADVDHGVHRGTATQRSASWQVDSPARQTLFRLGREVPIVLCLEQLREGGGHGDLRRIVPSSRLHQSYPDTGILAETGCEH